MRPEPVQQRARKKRQALLDAARLEFIENGYESTTAKSIAGRAGAATGSFYNYFDNKDEALLVLTKQRFETVSSNLPDPQLNHPGEAPDIEEIEQIFRVALEFIYEFVSFDSGMLQVLKSRRKLDQDLDDLMTQSEHKLLKQVEDFVSLFKVEGTREISFCLYAMAEGLVHRHVDFDAEVTRNQLINRSVEMLSAYFRQLLGEK